MATRQGSAFVDEESVLPFKVWVAELELVVGGAKGKRKPDAAACFQLLQKLVLTLGRAARPEVREYQRRCEDALVDVLLKGAPPAVSGGREKGRLEGAVSWRVGPSVPTLQPPARLWCRRGSLQVPCRWCWAPLVTTHPPPARRCGG